MEWGCTHYRGEIVVRSTTLKVAREDDNDNDGVTMEEEANMEEVITRNEHITMKP